MKDCSDPIADFEEVDIRPEISKSSLFLII